MQRLKIIYEWEKGMDLLYFWMQTVYLAPVLNQPGSVQIVSGSWSCRSCAECNGGLCRAWCLLWHVSNSLPGCCWVLLHAHTFALGTGDAELLLLCDRNCPAHKVWNTGDILVSSHASCSGDKYLLLQKKQRQLWVSGSDSLLGNGGAENGQNSVHQFGASDKGKWELNEEKREGKFCRHSKGNFRGWMFLTFFLIHVDLILSYHAYCLHIQLHNSDLKEAQGLNLTRKLQFNFFIPNSRKLWRHTMTMIRHLKAPITWVQGVEKLDFALYLFTVSVRFSRFTFWQILLWAHVFYLGNNR